MISHRLGTVVVVGVAIILPILGSGPAALAGVGGPIFDAAKPGDAKPGEHTVTSSCQASETDVVLSAQFRVTQGEHRSAFVTSLNQPHQISFTLRSTLLSAGISSSTCPARPSMNSSDPRIE